MNERRLVRALQKAAFVKTKVAGILLEEAGTRRWWQQWGNWLCWGEKPPGAGRFVVHTVSYCTEDCAAVLLS